MRNRIALLGCVTVTTAFPFLGLFELDAWGRAGGGTSFGSRGSRSFSSPSRTYSAPAPQPSPGTQPTQPAPAPMAQPAPVGGWWRSLAGGVVGGIAGGLLGGLLFRGLGFAGGAGGFGGSFGLMDLLLLVGIAYLIYWFVQRGRARQHAVLAGSPIDRSAVELFDTGGAPVTTPDAPAPSWQQELERGLEYLRQMDPGFDEGTFREQCTDRMHCMLTLPPWKTEKATPIEIAVNAVSRRGSRRVRCAPPIARE